MRENMHTQTKRVVGELRAHIDCSCGTQVQSTRAFKGENLGLKVDRAFAMHVKRTKEQAKAQQVNAERYPNTRPKIKEN